MLVFGRGGFVATPEETKVARRNSIGESLFQLFIYVYLMILCPTVVFVYVIPLVNGFWFVLLSPSFSAAKKKYCLNWKEERETIQ